MQSCEFLVVLCINELLEEEISSFSFNSEQLVPNLF